MGPKINGSNMAELVKQEVIKTVETQKHEMLEIKRMMEALAQQSVRAAPRCFGQNNLP